MSDIGALITKAGSTVVAGINAWGVSQEARRAAEYQAALTDTREGFSRLYQNIQQSPNYGQYETMFNGGADDLLEGVTEAYLSDPYVRQRFELEWQNIRESARASVQGYAFQQEKIAIATQGMSNLLDTHKHGGFLQAQQEATSIIGALRETNILNPAQEEQYWAEWRKLGAMELEARIDQAIENRDVKQVRGIISGAYAAEIIQTPEVAADRRRRAEHDIYYLTTQDQVISMGFEAGLEWLRDSGNAEELTPEERIKLRNWLLDERTLKRSEERYQRAEITRQFDEKLNDIYASLISGQPFTRDDGSEIKTFAEGLVFTAALSESMNRAEHTMWLDRFRMMANAEEGQGAASGEPDIFVAELTMLEEFNRLRDDILLRLRPLAEVQAEISKLSVSNPDFGGLIVFNTTRSGELIRMIQGSGDQVIESLDDILATKVSEDVITTYDRAWIRRQLENELRAKRVDPDGTYNYDAVTVQDAQSMLYNILEPIEKKNISALIVGGTNALGNFFRIMTGRGNAENAEYYIDQANRGRLTGVLVDDFQAAALGGGLTDYDALSDLFLQGRHPDSLSDVEKNILDRNVRVAQTGGLVVQSYTDVFGAAKTVHMNEDGQPVLESEWGTFTTLRVLNGDPQWHYWSPAQREWIYSESMSEAVARGSAHLPQPEDGGGEGGEDGRGTDFTVTPATVLEDILGVTGAIIQPTVSVTEEEVRKIDAAAEPDTTREIDLMSRAGAADVPQESKDFSRRLARVSRNSLTPWQEFEFNAWYNRVQLPVVLTGDEVKKLEEFLENIGAE